MIRSAARMRAQQEGGSGVVQRGEPVLGLMDEGDRPSVRAAQALHRRGGAAPVFEVAVVVAARDEEQNLPACLRSIVRQSEAGFALGRQWELIVVDDGSTDGTRTAVAEVFAEVIATDPESGAGLQMISAPVWEAAPKGSGMTGKSAACWAGAQTARGAWLLFTDADTVHGEGSVSRAVREAERHDVKLLSYSPGQQLHGWVQRAVMPLVFSELASVYPPAQVNDPGRPIAAANGQFLLVQTEAYFDVGGHRAAGMDVVEDVALARLIKRAGGGLRLRYAPEMVQARMYRTAGEMVRGWTKNLAALMPSPVALALWRLLDLVLLVGLPLLAVLWPGLLWWQRSAVGLIWVRTLVRFYGRVGRAHFGTVATAISPLGLPVFVGMLVRSVVQYRVRREVEWKGRRYNPNRR